MTLPGTGQYQEQDLADNFQPGSAELEMDLPDTQAGNDAWAIIQRGDVTGLSIGMIVKNDKWSEVDQDGQTLYKRTIIEADLYEIAQ